MLLDEINGFVAKLATFADSNERKLFILDPENDFINKLAALANTDDVQYTLTLEKIDSIQSGLKAKITSSVNNIINRETKEGIANDCVDGANVDELDMDRFNLPIHNHRNIDWLLTWTKYFHNRYGYDTFLLAPYLITDEIKKPIPEDEVFRTCVMLNKWIKTGLKEGTVKAGLLSVSLRNTTDALVEVTEAREKWNGTPILYEFPRKYFKLDQIRPALSEEMISFYCTLWAKWWIGAMARVYQPGCIFKSMLCLEGEQSVGKSGLARLLGEPYFSEDSSKNIDLGDVDLYRKFEGKWIVELAEMTSINKSDVETVKSFISQTVDNYRPKFHEQVRNIPRRFCMIATYNPDGGGVFKDPTGNVRFWPIPFGQRKSQRLDFVGIKADKEQMLAEALWRYQNGESWELTEQEEILQEVATGERTIENPVSHWIHEWLELNSGWIRKGGFPIAILLKHLGDIKETRHLPTISQALRKIGLQQKRFSIQKKQTEMWHYVDDYQDIRHYYSGGTPAAKDDEYTAFNSGSSSVRAMM